MQVYKTNNNFKQKKTLKKTNSEDRTSSLNSSVHK